MRFPEWLYRLLPGDAGSQLLGVVWREGAATGASPVSVDVYVVPNDKCLVLTNLAVFINPDPAVAVTRGRVMADPPDGNTRYNILELGGPFAADANVPGNWSGEVVIPGGWKVKCEGLFTGGAANSVNCELHGYLVPRGTFIFG